MKIKINSEKEIENCSQCPNSFYYAEQGFCGFLCCSKNGRVVSNKEIHKDCPFLKKD